MIIHKFGGTSVGSAARFAAAAAIILQHQGRFRATDPANDDHRGQVVVVSAMSGVTDRLIAGARAAADGQEQVYGQIKEDLVTRHLAVADQLLSSREERRQVTARVKDLLRNLERLYRSIAVLGEVTLRGYDAVTSFGEQLAAHLLAAALREGGTRAEAVSATELIVTDDHFGAARPLMEPTHQRLQTRLAPLLAAGSIPVVTGYIAATEAGVTTTLGRGGSDYSAAILGATLAANEVWIWSDVDGILTADPNLVPEARTLDELSYAEAAELAYYGADVLHPKTIRPLVTSGIPLRLLNSFNPTHPGTRIVARPRQGRQRLPAIISTTGLTMIALGAGDESWSPHLAARALLQLDEAGVGVPMFSQSFSEPSLNLVVRQQDQAHCLRVLCKAFNGELGTNCRDNLTQEDQKLQFAHNGLQLEIKENVATVSVVGVPGWLEGDIVSQAFAALGYHRIRVIAVAQAATEYSISFCIPAGQVATTVRLLHRELGLDGATERVRTH